MKKTNDINELNSNYNKEGKYCQEILHLLEGVIDSTDNSENELFKKLFTEGVVENNELVNLIKKLK
jgi:hypothetical protein